MLKNLSSWKIKIKDEKIVLILSDLEKSLVGESNNGEGDDVWYLFLLNLILK